jgi:hypothetical protein
MQLPTDAMSDEINCNGEVCLLCDRLEFARDAAPTSTWRGCGDGMLQHRIRTLDKRTALRGHVSDANGDRAIRAPTVEANTNVNGDEVTILYDARSGNPVHQLLIDADAGRGRKRRTRLRSASVPDEECLATTRENRTVRGLIDFRRRDARLTSVSRHLKHRCHKCTSAFNPHHIGFGTKFDAR